MAGCMWSQSHTLGIRPHIFLAREKAKDHWNWRAITWAEVPYCKIRTVLSHIQHALFRERLEGLEMFGELGYILTTTNQSLIDLENRTPKLLRWLIDTCHLVKENQEVMFYWQKKRSKLAVHRQEQERKDTPQPAWTGMFRIWSKWSVPGSRLADKICAALLKSHSPPLAQNLENYWPIPAGL